MVFAVAKRTTTDVTPDDGFLTEDSVHRPLSTFYSPRFACVHTPVDLVTDQRLHLPDGDLPRVFRHLAISSTGAVAVEGYVFVPSNGGGFVNGLADLMLYSAP